MPREAPRRSQDAESYVFSHVRATHDADSYVFLHAGEAHRHPRSLPSLPEAFQKTPRMHREAPRTLEGLPRARFGTSFGVHFGTIFKTKPDAQVEHVNE